MIGHYTGQDDLLSLHRWTPFVRSCDSEISEQIWLGMEDESNTPLFLEYEDDFPGFCRDILGVIFWQGQQTMCELLQRNPKVAISACYGSGKTYWAACLVIWWLWTRRPCLVVTTAPTGRQVKELLWANIRTLHLGARVNLGGRILVRETRITADRRGLGFAGDRPNSVAGYHEAENVLFIEDEAAGMMREVVQGYDGLTITPGSRWVKIGNPLAKNGPFWDCFNDATESLVWQTFSISAYGTPNVQGKTWQQIGFAPMGGLPAMAAWECVAESVLVKGLIAYKWVRERERKWGPEHPLFVCKVLGRWYLSQQALSVVPAEWVQLAAKRYAEELPGGSRIVILGVDVGGGVGRDNTSAMLRTGRKARNVGRCNNKDLPEQADWLVGICKKYNVKRMCVDGTGLGKGLFDICRRLKRNGEFIGVEICLVQMGNSPTAGGEKEFDLLVDQIWWAMREAFNPKGDAPLGLDPGCVDCIEQLPQRTWGIIGDGDGVIKIERKSEMIKRGLHSPDDADALAATFFEPPPQRSFST